MNETATDLGELDVPLDRDRFMRTLIGELAETLEKIVGVEDAAGYVSVVGTTIGDAINDSYRVALNTQELSRAEVAHVLVDLKRRIEGRFFLIEENEHRIVLGNKACPFGNRVLNRPSLCMMTSNVFGTIVAENLGYAKVELQQTIASGDPGCLIVIRLELSDETDRVEGREYFQSPA